MRQIKVSNESGVRLRLSPLRRSIEALLGLRQAESAELEVLVTTDERMRALNLEFRGLDEPTDVLSFPGPDWPGAPLGEVAVSFDFAKRGALARGVAVDCELAYLAVHGALHLLGEDDQTEDAREEMVRQMNAVMELVGLPQDHGWASQPHTRLSSVIDARAPR